MLPAHITYEIWWCRLTHAWLYLCILGMLQCIPIHARFPFGEILLAGDERSCTVCAFFFSFLSIDSHRFQLFIANFWFEITTTTFKSQISRFLSLSMSRARSLVGFAFKINRYSSIWSFETKQITKHWDLCLYARGFCVFALGVFLSWNNNIQFIKAHTYASLDREHLRKLAIFGSSTVC